MTKRQHTAAVIGGGPAGLMAAEILSAGGLAVTVYDRMPSVGRKFLMAGRGGLNLTHSEDLDVFLTRYGAATALRPVIEAFPPKALMAWAEGLGQKLFTGSSGRIFPKTMKASPLLRAWLARLSAQNVQFRLRQDCLGWNEADALVFRGIDERPKPDVTILALGGASWPKLGSDGDWVRFLPDDVVSALRPSNCGFDIAWSDVLKSRFAGTPLKNIALSFAGQSARGDAVITGYGIEGGAVYALSAALRDAITSAGYATLMIDLRPDMSAEQIAKKLDRPRGDQTLTNFLRKALALSPVEISLLREAHGMDLAVDGLAEKIKSVPLRLIAARAVERAISTAGGVRFSALDENLMLKTKPGVFIAGEMLDWEAPTGGYLLQACFATGVAAAESALRYLSAR